MIAQIRLFFGSKKTQQEHEPLLNQFNNLMELGAPIFLKLNMRHGQIDESVPSVLSSNAERDRRKSSIFIRTAARNMRLSTHTSLADQKTPAQRRKQLKSGKGSKKKLPKFDKNNAKEEKKRKSMLRYKKDSLAPPHRRSKKSMMRDSVRGSERLSKIGEVKSRLNNSSVRSVSRSRYKSEIVRTKEINLSGTHSRKLKEFLKSNGMAKKIRVREDFKQKIRSSTFDTFDKVKVIETSSGLSLDAFQPPGLNLMSFLRPYDSVGFSRFLLF